MNFENQEYDFIIVGSARGARPWQGSYRRKGKKSSCLSGARGPCRGNFLQYFIQQLIPGKCMLITNQFLGMVRGITTGGSSLFYYGTAFPVAHESF